MHLFCVSNFTRYILAEIRAGHAVDQIVSLRTNKTEKDSKDHKALQNQEDIC